MDALVDYLNNLTIQEPLIYDMIHFKMDDYYYYAIVIDKSKDNYYIRLIDNNVNYNIHKYDLSEIKIVEFTKENIEKVKKYLNEEINTDYITSWIDIMA